MQLTSSSKIPHKKKFRDCSAPLCGAAKSSLLEAEGVEADITAQSPRLSTFGGLTMTTSHPEF
jgi:hypothetical protein